jgi:hypothetical protein
VSEVVEQLVAAPPPLLLGFGVREIGAVEPIRILEVNLVHIL